MTRIKSAWEIALEKAKNMEVTPEELQKQREERCQLTGTAVADKFLSSFDLRELKDDLDKQGEEKELVAKAVVNRLLEVLKLGDYEKMEKITEGIFQVSGNEKIKEAKGRFYILFDSYYDVLRREIKEIEITGRKILGRLGISGEAIQVINPEINKEWRQSLKTVTQPYEKEFALYKQELLS